MIRQFCSTLVLLTLLTVSSTAGADTVRVVDGDTLDIGATRYRLHGIDTPEPGQRCAGVDGGQWPCGNDATKHLESFVRGKHVTCDNRGVDDYNRVISVCVADGVDINRELVRVGLAWAFRRFALDYVETENDARARRVGVFQTDTQTPWEYRSRKWRVAEQKAPDGCPIKGNISVNGKIYHTPWSPSYKRTRINLAKGERWFCDEREAIEAGWRAPRSGT